jgi:hypothetical protein
MFTTHETHCIDLIPPNFFWSTCDVIYVTDVIYVNWRDLCEVILFWIEVNWSGSEVSYGEVLGDESAMYIRVTLYWGYLIVLWLFYLVLILYCGCFNLFCNVWVCACVGFVMCVLIICVLVCTVFCIVCTVFFVLFRLCIFIIICFVCTSVRTTATGWQLNCS